MSDQKLRDPSMTVSRSFSYATKDLTLFHALSVWKEKVAYHVITSSEDGLYGYIHFRTPMRANTFIRLVTHDLSSMTVLATKGCDIQHREEITRQRTLRHEYGTPTKVSRKITPRSKRTEIMDHNHAVLYHVLRVEGVASLQPRLHFFLLHFCNQFTYHLSDSHFECYIRLKKSLRSSHLEKICSHHMGGYDCSAQPGKGKLDHSKRKFGPWTDLSSVSTFLRPPIITATTATHSSHFLS